MIIGKCLFDTSLTAVKISILFFYHRIFSVNRIFMRLAIFLGVICLCWWIAVVLGVILYCVPLKSIWQPSTPGNCINFGLYFLGSSIIDLLVDVALLALPCWIIPKLQLQRRVKWSLGGIFVLGGL